MTGPAFRPAGVSRPSQCRYLRSLRFAALSIAVLPALLIPALAHAADGVKPVSVHKLKGNVYEFDYAVSTGGDVHHRVAVHRVVQVRNGKPIAAANGVFLLHGDTWNFDAAFRGGTSANESVAVFLASKGIDVWGIDLGWTLVPASTTDFTFMRGWGLQRDINDVEKALAFARSVSARTGGSRRRLALLAWSRGGWIGYALLNEESQKPYAQRQVRAFIPVDTIFKAGNKTIRATACSLESAANGDIERGTYEQSYQSLAQLGANPQLSLTVGAATFRFGTTIVPHYHLVAGMFPNGNIEQTPTGLAYTDAARWNDFLLSARPFEPSTLIRDTWAISCNPRRTTRFDNHLKDVTVPVFYVGAGGGFGPAGLYSLPLLGSDDVSSHIISLHPRAQAALDFGHVDLFYARRAQQLVWKPIYAWLSQHAR